MVCLKCKTDKDHEAFHRDKRRPSGRYTYCKVCVAATCAARRKARPAHDKDWQIQKRYGISLAQFNDMREKQKNVCLICGESCGSGKALSIDHNHATGKVRGLLCSACNLGVGNFRENPDHLRAAALYLEATNG